VSTSIKIPGFANCRLSLLITCVALVGFCSSAAAQAAPQLLPYTVSAAAGGGTYGTTYGSGAKPFSVGQACATGSTLTATNKVGDGCLATQVLLSTPRAAAADSEGNLYIVDSNNQSIRRVDAHTGIITTVAGSVAGTATVTSVGGTCPSGSLLATDTVGGGCPATSIILAAPQGIAVDTQGNVWFTDYTQGTVREVSKSTGILYTIVNTTGSSGYKADNVNYTATGITAANGKLYRPYGLTFDKKGNLYIADNYNNVVDVVNLGSAATTIAGYTVPAGEIFTIAGAGCPYTTTPGCTSSSYYGKSNGTGVSTSATLHAPYQVAVDNTGNIYIADEANDSIRVINTSGAISTFAGVLGSYSATLPSHVASTTAVENTYGVANDSYGNVYFTSSYSTTTNYFARVDIASNMMYVVAGQSGTTYCSAKTDSVGDGCPGLQATLSKPYQLSVDAAGNVYVTDQGNNLIRKVSVGTQFPATAVGTPVTQSIDIHFGVGDTPAATSAYALPSGFTDFALGTASCTPNSDNTDDCVLPVTFTPSAAGIRTAPLTVTSAGGKASNFSLTGTGLASVLAVDPGTESTLANTNLTAVNSIALDAAGNVYASVPGSSSIVAVTSAGAESTRGSSLSGANAVAVDAAGNIYAALPSGSVIEIPGNGGSQFAIGSGFTNPSGIAVDSFGNVYVADSAANSVSEILAGTGAQIFLANQTTVPTLSGPTGVTVDSYGNVFVANTVNNNIIELPFGGGAALTLGSGLSSPVGLAVDPAGSLYIADSRNNRIAFIPNENGVLTTADQMAIITGLGSPTGVAIAGSGTVYVADSFNNAIYTFVRSSAIINFPNAEKTENGSTPAESSNPVAADIISMGTEPATFGASFWTPGGSAPGDFVLSPSTLPTITEFPGAGYGVSLTAIFTPTATGNRSATYTYDSTIPVIQPTLTLNGTGANPTNATTTTIAATAPSGGWVYGDTVTVNVTVTVSPGQPPPTPVPTGNVSVYVDSNAPINATLTPGTTNSIASVQLPGLSAGGHSIYVTFGGDSESVTSTSSTLTLTFAQAPLTVTVNNASVNFDAPVPNPVTTGKLSGVQNGEQIGISYSTSAIAGSPVGQYLITAQVTGSALTNYTVTVANGGPNGVAGGTLTIVPDNTLVTLGTSASSVNSTTQVTLTATVANQTAYAMVSIPTGSVSFFNTVGTTKTLIGTGQIDSTTGVAAYVTTFAAVGATTNNVVTATYNGDTNFLTSTSAPVTVVSGVPTFALTPPTTTSVSVAPGQSGLMSFTLTPAYGYNGTISFSCTGAPAKVSCAFSPSTISPNGSSTPSLVALTINTTAAETPISSNKPPAGFFGSRGVPFLAAIPGLALLWGFSRRRRKLLRGYRSLLLLALCLLGIGFTGCGGNFAAGTPTGTTTITVVATGTAGSFTSVTQQFNVTLVVQ
jgi:sugar lactone lactonase YvrE